MICPCVFPLRMVLALCCVGISVSALSGCSIRSWFIFISASSLARLAILATSSLCVI